MSNLVPSLTSVDIVISVKDKGAAGDGVTDDTVAIQAAIGEVAGVGGTIFFPIGNYIVSNSLINGTAVIDGLKLVGESHDIDSSSTGSMITYTGSGTCFYFLEPNGTQASGQLEFCNMTFKATNSAATMFAFNNVSIAPTDDSSTYGYILGIKFSNCSLWGPGGNPTGNAIQGAAAFQMYIDPLCIIRGWKRGVYLYGCDNCTISGRMYLNGRNIHIERIGTFGNDCLVTARFLGTPLTTSVSEDQYNIYESGQRTTIIGTILEDTSATTNTALMYVNGFMSKYYGMSFSASGSTIPILSIGANARGCTIDSPTSTGAFAATIVAEPNAIDIVTTLKNFPGITVSNASGRFVAELGKISRIRYADGINYEARADINVGNEILTSLGPSQKKLYISPLNYMGRSAGTGWTAPTIVTDTTSYLGSAIQIDSVNSNGFAYEYTVGDTVNVSDIYKLTVLYKMSGTPGAGTFRWIYKKNGTNVSNGALAVSATYARQVIKIDLSTFADTDLLSIGFYNASVTDQTCNIAYASIEKVEAHIADSVGSDEQAKINAILAALRAAHILSES